MPESAWVGYEPLMLKEMQTKAPWTMPAKPPVITEHGVVERRGEKKVDAEATHEEETGAAPPLPPQGEALVNAYVRRREKMDGLGALDSRANLARASALLRAEAWRRKHESKEHKLHHQKTAAHKIDSSDYWDPTKLGARLDHLIEEATRLNNDSESNYPRGFHGLIQTQAPPLAPISTP